MSTDRILVVRNDKLGDFMLAWPALAMLRASLPEAHLAVLVPEYTRELADLCPSVDEVLIDRGGAAPTAELAACLTAGAFDAMITLFSTTRVGWAGWRAGIAYRLAPATKLAQFFYNERLAQRRSRSEKPEHEYNCDLIRHFLRQHGASVVEPSAPYLRLDAERREQLDQAFRVQHAIDPRSQLIFLHAGSGGSANNLALEQYATLASALSTQAGHALILTAGPGERAYVEQLASLLPSDLKHIVLESTAGLAAFAELINLASLFIAGSTGTLHLAGALDVPTAAFYPRRRSSTPLRWQTLNSPGRRLAWCPSVSDAERDMSSIDLPAAAKEINELLAL